MKTYVMDEIENAVIKIDITKEVKEKVELEVAKAKVKFMVIGALIGVCATSILFILIG